ncbi:hypothetical protein CY35_19G086200 [Sphagnum magellanicum]|nr:hypothetical protein CY35_19G086200 [Sphagnum magellanicum]
MKTRKGRRIQVVAKKNEPRERLDEMGRRREMLSRHQTLNTFLRCSCVPLRPPVSIASGIENRTRLEAGDVVGSYNAAAATGQGVSRVSTSVREDRSEHSALCYNEATRREHQTLKGRTGHSHYGTVAPSPRMGICELAVLLSLCLSVRSRTSRRVFCFQGHTQFKDFKRSFCFQGQYPIKFHDT